MGLKLLLTNSKKLLLINSLKYGIITISKELPQLGSNLVKIIILTKAPKITFPIKLLIYPYSPKDQNTHNLKND